MHKGWVDKILCAFIYECIIIDQIKSCNKKINITVRFYYIEVPLQLNSIVYLCIHTGGHAVYILLKVTETMERHPSKSHNGHHQDAPWGKNTWKKIPLFISCHHFHEYMCNKWLVSHREQMCPQWSLGNGKRREARQCVCVCVFEGEREEETGWWGVHGWKIITSRNADIVAASHSCQCHPPFVTVRKPASH